MSYDLFFTEPAISQEQFASHFSERPCYQLNEGQAWYQNEDTGVYFSFDYAEEEPEDPEAPEGCVSFNLNFYRPHYFGLEAEPEVRALVDRFGFKILDPQNEGMGEGEYTTEGFLRGWNAGNDFGYRAILGSGDAPEVVHSRPKEELEAIWRWNYSRGSCQSQYGEDVFVPIIMFVQSGADLHSIAVWPDAIPTLIPLVDSLVVPREELAPRPLRGEAEDSCFVPFDRVRPVLERYATEDYARPAFCLSYTSVPDDISRFVENLEPFAEELQGVPADDVLNRELVDKYRRG
jgi:hypothetical protein